MVFISLKKGNHWFLPLVSSILDLNKIFAIAFPNSIPGLLRANSLPLIPCGFSMRGTSEMSDSGKPKLSQVAGMLHCTLLFLSN